MTVSAGSIAIGPVARMPRALRRVGCALSMSAALHDARKDRHGFEHRLNVHVLFVHERAHVSEIGTPDCVMQQSIVFVHDLSADIGEGEPELCEHSLWGGGG